MEFHNIDGLELLSKIPDNSIDLVLTDPPYIISRESGMNTHYNTIKKNEENSIEFIKTEDEWNEYKTKSNITDDTNKDNYMKYGTIYGKKYSVKTDYGSWDKDFKIEDLNNFISQYYKKLKKGGTLIIFFDLWKITNLKECMVNNKFKQIRFIEWIKTNPQPLNSSTNYLTNCREIALLGIKGSKPTFNSKYDNALYNNNDDIDNEIENYMYPLQGGKNRFHPTQKSLPLFEELIKKHSNENDTVLDTFLGGGTTLFAARNTGRKFIGCELSKEYYDKVMALLDKK